MSDSAPQDLLFGHAWRYFELHANQRMSLFNFFLVLSGLVSAGLAASIQGSARLASLGVVLGLLLALVSFVFWKLDQRVSFLVKHAEQAISELEQSLPAECVRLFHLEPQQTERTVMSGHWWSRHWTYGRSFRTVFAIMGVFGVGGSALSVLRFAGAIAW